MKNLLKTYIKSIFPFDKNELGYHILGLIAKKEGLVEYQIVNHLAKGTRRTVNNSLKNFLIPNNFLYVTESVESYRNIKNAFNKGREIKPKKYQLTFKGFIVSLVHVKLKDNYIMKKYLEFFPEKLKDDVLEYIANEISSYTFYCSFIGLTLNNVHDLVFHMDDTLPNWQNIGLETSKVQKMNELESRQQQLFDKIIKHDEKFSNLLEYWPNALELITKYPHKKILKELKKEVYDFKFNEKDFMKNMSSNF